MWLVGTVILVKCYFILGSWAIIPGKVTPTNITQFTTDIHKMYINIEHIVSIYGPQAELKFSKGTKDKHLPHSNGTFPYLKYLTVIKSVSVLFVAGFKLCLACLFLSVFS